MGFLPDPWRRGAGEFGRRATIRGAAPAARLWRRCFPSLRSIAITGSYGKSTCRRILAATLQRIGPTLDGVRGTDGSNFLARSVLDLRPRHRFGVFEVSGDAPGTVAPRAALAQPHIGVVLSVGGAHLHNFAGLETIAAEKRRLLDALPRDGVAVLNADDPRTAAMAARASARRVVLFGRSPSAPVRAADVEARWPDRLRFRLIAPSGEAQVRTRLVGEQWLPAVLGAAAAALECGAALEDIVAAAAEMEPPAARFQPVALPGGATMLRDEFNGTEDSWAPALAVLARARVAGRRILVAGESSQSMSSRRDRLRALGARAAASCDWLVSVGDKPKYAIQGAKRAGFDPERILCAYSPSRAAEALAELLQPGDLVLLKARHADHLSRVYWRLVGPVACEKEGCRKILLCDHCPELRPVRSR